MESEQLDPPTEKKPREDVNQLPPTAPGFTRPTPNSKNQLKKQRKLEQQLQLRKERRRQEKERQKQKRREAAEKGLPTRTGPSRKDLKKRLLKAGDNENPLRIVIDLDCDDMMNERDMAKCVKQCLRIYTINRRSECPVQLHFTGIKTDGNIHRVLKKNDGWENWHLNYHFDETHLQVFDNKEIIYLTSESDVVLDTLVPQNVYVIGGLVDHNHHKNFCHDRATKAGLKTARLPLGEYVDMKTRAVLTTFHVFEILVRVAEGKSWSDAILQTIPPRKGAKAKQLNNDETNNDKDIENINEVDENSSYRNNDVHSNATAEDDHGEGVNDGDLESKKPIESSSLDNVENTLVES
ncbi:tRNA methyltransferase 10 homolog A [Stomoxys calcitrans]|uniref:tRNA methyltransferase 10 homolog A n=1 Tax=Stomoxys calcitrans TaxID=35570 RepID=UPI0027E335A9|nr:tRNA methyltransferase 10 homolog A [Stomoxys calcitrans]